jgi:hypothetical protein
VTFLIVWLVFPLLFGGLAWGCGLLLEHACGRTLRGAVRLPAGYALVLVAAGLTTMSSTTATLTVPLVVSLAVAGFGLSWPLRPRPDPWACGCAAAAYAVYAAPIVLSGSATFAGYITLDDSADWFGIADRALAHGRSLAGLAPSSYSVVLHDSLAGGYPIGSIVPLGLAHELTGRDVAWLFQPYIAFLGAMLGLALFALLEPLVPRRSLRGLVAFLGAQPALLFGYAFWSGIKEMTIAYLVVVAAALAAVALREAVRQRDLVPLAAAAAALLVCQSVLGVVWLAGLVLFAGLLVRVNGARRSSLAGALAVGCGLVLALPALATGRVFVRGAAASDSGHGALGNLFHPLSILQLGGIWPAGDFRGRPTHMALTYLLLVAVLAAAVLALVWAFERRAFGLPLYLCMTLAGFVLVRLLHAAGHGSPWLDGKALASASPGLLVAALAGAAVLYESSRLRLAGGVLLVLIGSGVLWSNALAYGDVWLAPRAQLAELETVGDRFAGQGPTLMTEYQPYGVRHFLRALDPEGASERRARPVALRDGGVLDKAQYADLDAFDLSAVLVYRTLVLRRSPLASRPPVSYVPAWTGRFYEVWQRPQQAASVLEHLPLGSPTDPEAVPDCAEVLRLGSLAERAGGTLVAATRPASQVVNLAAASRPAGWLAGVDPGTVLPQGAGTLIDTFTLAKAGRENFWLGGSFRDRVRLFVDGRLVGSARDQLEETAQLTPLGAARLAAGPHELELRYDGFGWRPGSRGPAFLLGPLAIGLPATSAHLIRAAPSAAASLCGRRLDWLEAIAPGRS